MPLSPPPDWSRHVLHFWFDELTEQQWWSSTPEVDDAIRARFDATYRYAAEADLQHLTETAETSLAAVVALDQFPRNMFRRAAQAFATDAKALEVAKHALSKGHDMQMAEKQRHFFYMPFMHAEDVAAQKRAVEIFTGLAATAPGRDDGIRSALEHQAIIERFGRFPHRNAALGRADTPEERAYLSGDAKRFGQ